MKIKCPKCGSTDVICEAEADIRFVINEHDDIEIISDWEDIAEDIENYNVVYRCECQDCCETFMYDKEDVEDD